MFRDSLLAVALVAPALVDPPGGWLAPIILAALVVPLIGRRRRPAAMTAIVLAAAWAGLLTRCWTGHLPLAHLSLLVMLYTLIAQGRRRAALVAGPVTAAFFVVWSLAVRSGADAGWSALCYVLGIATAWLLAEYVRAKRAYLGSIKRRAELADSERRALSRAAAAEERSRIARELHDVLAHSVSVMVVNAEGAQLARHTDPAAVDRTLALVAATGREALTELRRLLTVLDADGPIGAPQPTLADLHRLTTGVDGAELHVSGDGDGVPPGAAVQVYRIVQEALTNVVKHAGVGAGAQVSVDLGVPGPDRKIRIEVTNDGTRSSPALPSSGRGLAGMRERVAMFGGDLDAAPRPEGGYRIVATLPLDAPVTVIPQADAGSMGGCSTGHRRASCSATTRR
ncbi:sensor histidine kinase [Actinoplanes sp. TBRC 11911]|uniref:sensor histidine kinase n=1 Tax=Actinoplanes sp. TBRC 11911 TaxID=2729386 RepID=UPI00145FAC3F|nr:histidine kinase [Actinoplanes sp. TBRC 11911]NMO49999.1 sensor histidine kinase [Actinoplanes sp. TBRC 11911]